MPTMTIFAVIFGNTRILNVTGISNILMCRYIDILHIMTDTRICPHLLTVVCNQRKVNVHPLDISPLIATVAKVTDNFHLARMTHIDMLNLELDDRSCLCCRRQNCRAKQGKHFTLQKDLPPGELVKKKAFLIAASIENTGNGIYCYRTRLYSISHHYQIVMSLSTCCSRIYP